jgi:hypothetical protein
VLIANGGTLDLTPSLDNLSINTTGGIQGFNKTYAATPSATYHVSFDPFSVPDAITVSDSTHVYIKSGFISDDNGSGPLSRNFTVASNSTGKVTINVVGGGSSTQWDLSVSRVSQPFVFSPSIASATSTPSSAEPNIALLGNYMASSLLTPSTTSSGTIVSSSESPSQPIAIAAPHI